MAEIISSLNIQFNQILVQIIGFIILFVVLKKALWGPVLGLIKSREDEVRGTYDKAEALKKEMEHMQADLQSRLSHIDEEGQKLLAEAVRKGQEMAEEIVHDARKQASFEQEKAMNAIREETSKARVELKDFSVGLAFELADKVLKAHVDKNAHEALVAKFLTELDATGKEKN